MRQGGLLGTPAPFRAATARGNIFIQQRSDKKDRRAIIEGGVSYRIRTSVSSEPGSVCAMCAMYAIFSDFLSNDIGSCAHLFISSQARC